DRSRCSAMVQAARNTSRETSASWVGWDDHTHSLTGFTLPRARLDARRFHTMYPVYFGLCRISYTDDGVHFPTARPGSTGCGGGYVARSAFSMPAMAL